MKKLVAIILVLAMLSASMLALTACGKERQGSDIDLSQAKAYSIDLTDIQGYTYKVTNGTWAEAYDAVGAMALAESDPVKRFKILHKMEDLLMETGVLVPIYYYTDIYMISSDLTGFYSSPFGYKYFMQTKLAGKTANIDICLSSEPASIDPALNSTVDGATTIVHCFSGLIKYGLNSAGLLEHQPDLAKSIPSAVVEEDGSATYTFELKDGLKWSDGTSLTAADLVYSWNRAVDPDTGADYSYMFAGISTNEDGTLQISADGNKFTVKCDNVLPYFMDLCAFPTFFPVQKATIEANGESWATSPATYVGNGPYMMKSWDHDSNFVLVKNPNYYDAASVTMEQITFNLTDDDNAMLANYKTGTWQFIDSVPNTEIPTLQAEYPEEFVIAPQLGTYYVCFNNNKNLLPLDSKISDPAEIVKANNEVRRAISLLFDRNYIVEEIGQAGQAPASAFVSYGVTNPDGTFFSDTAGGNSYAGYWDTSKEAYEGNIAKAVEMLKKYYTYDEASGKFTNFPSFEYLYNTGTGHQAIGEYMQACLAQYGITITLTNQEWNTFTETRKNGDFTFARNGWVMDYNDPNNMLEMWYSESGNNDVQLGKYIEPTK